MRIGVKVGSALLTKHDPWGYVINTVFSKNLMVQLSRLITDGHEVFLVSSGAVISDRNQDRSRMLRAAVGQHKLMALYQRHLNSCEPPRDVAQILLVADELRDNRQHIQELVESSFPFQVLPIINANDAVNGQELDRLEAFEDNDNLFLEICLMLKPNFAIIATNVSGVLDHNKQTIHRLSVENDLVASGYVMSSMQENCCGTGGMISKIKVAGTLTAEKIATIIVNGQEDDFVVKSLDQLTKGANDGYRFGTSFVS